MFVFKAIIEKRKAGCTLTDILSNVSGADINPLAVLTAKTNYLLAVIDLVDGKTEIEIPIYNADIIKLDEVAESDEIFDFLTCENSEKYRTSSQQLWLDYQLREDLKKLSFHAYSKLREVKSQMAIINQMAMPAVEGDKIRITNVVERAKRKTRKVRAESESKYVFPMLKGSNVKKWSVTYDTYLLCPHTKETKMWPVSQEILKAEVPETYHYLLQFKDNLDGRKGFADCVKSYMNPTSISAHVLNKLNIPEFDRSNNDHLAIARACKADHGARDISHFIEEIDRIVAQIYGV